MNRDLKDAYIETNDNSTNPPPIKSEFFLVPLCKKELNTFHSFIVPGAVTTTPVGSSPTGSAKPGQSGAAVSVHSGMGSAVGSAMVAGLALLTGGRLIQW